MGAVPPQTPPNRYAPTPYFNIQRLEALPVIRRPSALAERLRRLDLPPPIVYLLRLMDHGYWSGFYQPFPEPARSPDNYPAPFLKSIIHCNCQYKTHFWLNLPPTNPPGVKTPALFHSRTCIFAWKHLIFHSGNVLG